MIQSWVVASSLVENVFSAFMVVRWQGVAEDHLSVWCSSELIEFILA